MVDVTRDEALAALEAHHVHAQKTRAQLDAEELQLVAAAREAGASWQKIGNALGGMLRNNTQRKYEHRLDVTDTRQVRVKTDDSSKETPMTDTTERTPKAGQVNR